MISIKNAELIECNFSGECSAFNPEGKRRFLLVIEDAQEEAFKEYGCRIFEREGCKCVRVSANGAVGNRFITISTSIGDIALDETDMAALDVMPLKDTEVIVAPIKCEVGSKTIRAGVYLKSMRATFDEKELKTRIEGIGHPDLFIFMRKYRIDF